MPELAFDKEFWAAAGAVLTFRPPPARNALQLRGGINAALKSLLKGPIPADVVETKHEVISYDGERIALHQFAPATKKSTEAQPAFIYVHGGGLVAGDVHSRLSAARAASQAGVRMFAVEYRLPPEHPYPTPVEDVYAAVRWVSENAGTLGVDPARLGLYGLSAGGGLAAGAALMARDRGLSPPLAKQILVYPMLDDRTRVGKDDPLAGFLTWTDRSNQLGWNAYLEGKAGGDDVPEYAAPARASSLEGLPSTYVDIGGLDMFCAETVEFARRLTESGVQLELHVYPGVPHTFDLYAADIEISRRASEERLRATRSL